MEAKVLGSPAKLYRRTAEDRIVCTACARYCTLKNNQVGLCGVRGVVDNQLRLFVYGKVITGHVDPIEKKPVTHYRPGTKIFSIATTGCNWLCAYCQNFDISQRRKVEGVDAPPERVVEMALRYGSDGIAYTYNEPSIFMEYAHDIGVIARRKGLINVFVTNGYWTPEAVGMAAEFLDCATVDFKGSGEKRFVQRYIGIPDAEPVFQTLLEIKRTKIHVEITDLIVPEIGDSLEAARRLCRWVYENLGQETPIHFLRFHPDYKLLHLPWTPVETLEKHCQIAREEGLLYVYVGNVPGHPLENTYCPGCGKVVVERHGYDILDWRLDKDNRCLECGSQVHIVGRPPSKKVSGRLRFIPVNLE
ncbi:MAG: AmmeMemoRadiSam system radical SAM enzyme [Candidatus Caldarchaeum sp.]